MSSHLAAGATAVGGCNRWILKPSEGAKGEGIFIVYAALSVVYAPQSVACYRMLGIFILDELGAIEAHLAKQAGHD